MDRYHLRPAYPPETFALLNELIVDELRVVLDVGCGPGNVARPMAEYVERVDAVDISLPMLVRGVLVTVDDFALFLSPLCVPLHAPPFLGEHVDRVEACIL